MPFQWHDASDWGFKPSEDLRITLRMIPLVVVLILGFALGLTRAVNPSHGSNPLVDEMGRSHKAQLQDAYSCYVSKDYSHAVATAALVLLEDPENALASHIIGLADARRGLTEEAALSFQRAVALDPDFALAWYDLGVVDESRGEFARALDAYRKASELEPENKTYSAAASRVENIVAGEGGREWRETASERLFLAGVTAVNKGGADDFAYAESIFRNLLEDRPYDIAVRNMLGLVLARQGRLDEAESVLLEVVESEPGYSNAWYNLGMIHRSQGRLEDALNDFETACSSSSIRNFRAVAAKEVDEVKKLLESETVIEPPENPDVPDQ